MNETHAYRAVGRCRLMAVALRLMLLAGTMPMAALALGMPKAAARADDSAIVVASPPTFRVVLPRSSAERPISGRLYLFFSQRTGREPRFGPNWFRPEPFFRVDVSAMAPGSSQLVDDRAAGFPDVLSKLPPGTYRVQALLDHDFYYQHHALGPGNLYSEVKTVRIVAGPSSTATADRRSDDDSRNPQPAETGPSTTETNSPADGSSSSPGQSPLSLVLDRVVQPRPLPQNRWLHPVQLRSERLSQFHQRDVIMRAMVVLPASYEHAPDRRYPVLYVIGGFGSTLERMARRYRNGPPPVAEGQAEFIRVLLSGNCKWGHHVYADSATNGPRGTAFVQEMVPHIDQTFRTIAQPTARLLTGHSSGGWASLWLQVRYPRHFGGVWSTAPDPVDFRDFQQVNLYADPPQSLYFDPAGHRRPLARQGEEPVLWYQDFARMDDVLGRGGQLRSFEAVFSPLDDRGLPKRLWNRTTGRIDPHVAQAWQKYDIRLRIQRHWPKLEPHLRGKLHIYMGTLDTFYLDGAVRLLAHTLQQLGSDAEVRMIEGASHSSLLSGELVSHIRRQMSDTVARHHPEAVAPVAPAPATDPAAEPVQPPKAHTQGKPASHRSTIVISR